MDNMTIIAVVSIVTAGLTIALGSIGPAIGEGRAVSTALSSLAQQPDASQRDGQAGGDDGDHRDDCHTIHNFVLWLVCDCFRWKLLARV